MPCLHARAQPCIKPRGETSVLYYILHLTSSWEFFFQLFLSEGERMVLYSQKAIRCGATPGYASRILDACVPQHASPGRQTDSVESLTSREMQILSLVARGCSNRQTATRFIIISGTIKPYLTHIFGKFGVEIQTQAAARAREQDRPAAQPNSSFTSRRARPGTRPSLSLGRK